MDYGLPIYGQCAKSTLATLNAPYHTAIRRSLRAFPTTPIRNMLAESGLPSIDERYKQSLLRLISKLYFTNNAILNKDVVNVAQRRRRMKKPSAIFNSVQCAKDINILLKPIFTKPPKYPPWHLLPTIFINKLLDFPKRTTNPTVYQKTFLEIVENSKKEGWKFIFTDGSKSEQSTSFAVVSEEGKTIQLGLLFPHHSVFAAEAFAINFAIKYATASKDKFVICTDSKSTITALRNPRNIEPLIENSKALLIQHFPKIKIMWIPGHCGIGGNEYADITAKGAYKTPCLYHNPLVKSDTTRKVNNHIREWMRTSWQSYQHGYKLYNQHRIKPTFPKTSTADQLRIITRLRMGHTKITHEHLLNGELPPHCAYCNCQLSIKHILDDCKKFKTARRNVFKKETPTNLLKTLNTENIQKIYYFIFQCKLFYLI